VGGFGGGGERRKEKHTKRRRELLGLGPLRTELREMAGINHGEFPSVFQAFIMSIEQETYRASGPRHSNDMTWLWHADHAMISSVR
jgi:hypothetical protein